jgi:hypothetical protein
MKRSSSLLVAGLGAVAMGAAPGALIVGCSSATCDETATCGVEADNAGADASLLPDGPVDGGTARESAAEGGDGPDAVATNGADGGADANRTDAGADVGEGRDGSVLDAAGGDMDVLDSSVAEASVVDVSATDASVTDAAAMDAPATDVSLTDGAVTDASVADTSIADAWEAEAGDAGADVADASVSDANDAGRDAADAAVCATMWPDGGTNAVTNPDFESATDAGAGWSTQFGGGTFSVSSTIAHCGTHSGEISSRSAYYDALSTPISTTAGTYAVALWVLQDGTSTLQMTIQGYAVCGGAQFINLSPSSNGFPFILPNTWTFVSGTLTIPSGCTAVNLVVAQDGAQSSLPDVYVDDVFVSK